MEPLSEAPRLLRRQSELEGAMRRPAGIRLDEERDIYALREQQKHHPAAVLAILDAASRLDRPVETPSPRDVEAGQWFGPLNQNGFFDTDWAVDSDTPRHPERSANTTTSVAHPRLPRNGRGAE